MQTDLQKRNRQIEDIILLADLEGEEHKTLRQQLESMTFMSIDVTHKLITRIALKEPELSFERK